MAVMWMMILWGAHAFAQTGPAKAPSTMELLIMPMGFLLIMYFFILRPQQKKAKEMRDLLGNLKSGDEVVTTGGLIGKVRSVTDNVVVIEVANNTAVKVLKSAVASLMGK